MDEHAEYIAQLLLKHINGTLSENEALELRAWAAEKSSHAALLEQVNSATFVTEKLRAYQGRAIPRPDEIPALRNAMANRGSRLRYLRGWLPYAAAIVFVLFVGVLTYQLSSKVSNPQNDGMAADIQPGGNRATLVLENGSTIDLSAEHSGIIVGQTIKYIDGSMVRIPDKTVSRGRKDAAKPGAVTEDGAPNYLALVTPRGGQYQVTLPDGTRVWLNAASSLRYPSRFMGDERIVELEGEAYFEVSERWSENSDRSAAKQPFLVKTKAQTVVVLGTRFNVAAYPDEPETKTTLIEGAVLVSPVADRPSTAILKPGQQAILSNGQLNVRKLDAALEVAWINGYFTFENETVQSIMRKAVRWYDRLEVEYEGIPDKRYTGGFSRKSSLSQFLQILELNNIRYERKANKVVIKP